MKTNWALELAVDSVIIVAVISFVVYACSENDRLRYWALMVIAMAGVFFGAVAVLKRLPIQPPGQSLAAPTRRPIEWAQNSLVVLGVVLVFVYNRARDDTMRRWALITIIAGGALFAALAVLDRLPIWPP